jgi:protoporphyrinogen oxidase
MNNLAYASTVILGCGLAGAGCARQLPGARVFEAADHIGGHAVSRQWQGFSFDEGAHICHSKDEDFLRRIGVGSRTDIGDVVSKTANWDRGRWLSYPVQNHLHQLPVDERIAALTGFVRAQGQQAGAPGDYLQWCRAQYGDYLTETYYKRYTEKYWRTDMAAMDIDWLSGRLLPTQVDRVVAGAIASQEEKQPVFARFRYPRQGGFMALMQPLFDGLAVTLNERAVAIDARARKVTFASGRAENYDHLVSTLPLPKLVAMLANPPASVRDAAASLRWTQLVCVDFVVARPNVVPWHWFYIYDTDIDTSRVSVPSNLAEDPRPLSAFQAELFRRDDEKLDPATLQALGEKAALELTGLLGIAKTDILDIKTTLVPFGYVVPCLGHARAAAHVLEWLQQQNIEAAGLHGRWKYVWSDAAYRSGEAAAAAIAARMKQ